MKIKELNQEELNYLIMIIEQNIEDAEESYGKTYNKMLNDLYIKLNNKEHTKTFEQQIEIDRITIKTQEQTIKIYKDFASATSEYLTNLKILLPISYNKPKQ
tara:strand:- start:327 stop:632 length:306 start_codon:yes stop_codon:yes gene_type:complete